MIKNYLTVACRHLFKNRLFTFLNLLGLSTGLASALLICLWVYDEWRMDRFHEKGNRLFQVMEHRPHEGGINTTTETAPLLAEALAQNMPELVEYAAVSTPLSWFPKMAIWVGDHPVKAAAVFAGRDYFNIFSYPMVEGGHQALADKNGIVISEKLAMELFHTTQNITGKTISWQIYDIKKQGMITGVFKGTPAASSAQFDLALSFDAFKDIAGISGAMNSQNSVGPFDTYVVLRKGVDASRFNTRLSAFLTANTTGQARNMFIKPYAERYLYGTYGNGIQSGGRITYVHLFSLIALFIILIACINFMNLSTAKASGRMKEIGIRKSMGAGRGILVLQHLGESVLMSVLSLIFALALVWALLPFFNEITGKRLTIPADLRLLSLFGGITLLTGLIAGSYPAVYLSGFNPVAVLKGKLHRSAGELWARKGLVTFQFSLSLVFIVAVLIVYRQIAYIQAKDPGYDKDHTVYFESEGKVAASMPAFLEEVRKLPGVTYASAMVGNVLGGAGIPINWKGNGKDETILFRNLHGHYDLIETLGLTMAAGRAFSHDFGTEGAKIIFNEAAIKALGITDPVGKQIQFGGRQREIAGVVKNFHFQSLHEPIRPLFIELELQTLSTVFVRIQAGMEAKVTERLRDLYRSYNPAFSFEYSFLDADYQAQYIAEKRVAALAKYFAGLAVLISCLGLFGLTAFAAERRRREIGIRKVLGATANSVALLLSKDFLSSVLVAVIIATPLAWWIMERWLDGFVYHIQLQAMVFLVAGGALIGLTLLIVSLQAFKAALANPADNLRTE